VRCRQMVVQQEGARYQVVSLTINSVLVLPELEERDLLQVYIQLRVPL